jgi:hypothetical protein
LIALTLTLKLFAAIAKDKVCESSPIDLNIVAFGQWDLAKQGGRERCGLDGWVTILSLCRNEVSPPLEASNPLLISKELLGSQEVKLTPSS